MILEVPETCNNVSKPAAEAAAAAAAAAALVYAGAIALIEWTCVCCSTWSAAARASDIHCK